MAVPAVCGVVDGLAVVREPALVVQVGARRAAAIRRAVRGPPADGGQQPVGDGKAGPGFARRQVLLEDRVSADVFDKRHAVPGVLARVGVRVRGARAPNATGLAVVVSVRVVEIGGLCLVVLPPIFAHEPPVVEAPVQRAHLLRGVGGAARERAVVEDALVRYARVFLLDPVVGRGVGAGLVVVIAVDPAVRVLVGPAGGCAVGVVAGGAGGAAVLVAVCVPVRVA